jgi:hypothetical protein
MGEAKRRKAQDPSYGRPIRGLVMTSIVPRENGVRVHGSLDPHALRHALLFWDKLVWPSNNLIDVTSGQDIVYLEAAKILERPRYSLSGSIDVESIVRSQLEEFKKREAAENGVWDLCQNSSLLLEASGEMIPGGGLGIELVDAIPVPDKDVPLNEILEFKRKRNDEFTALRTELDSLGRAINTAQDPAAELKRTIAQIDKSCADVLRVSGEWQFPIRLSNQKMALDLKPFEVLAGGIAAATLASSAALSTTYTVLSGIGGAVLAAKSAIKITGDIGLQGIKRRMSPFAYVADVHTKLF